jgi:prepilin-type N-terminal cleavage/methylation domain-containing protein
VQSGAMCKSLQDRSEMNMAIRQRSDGETGFTLVEVAIASAIIAGGLLFLANSFTLGMYQNKHIKQMTSAIALAQGKMEELRSLPSGDPGLAPGGNLTGAITGYSDQVYVDDSGGTVTTTIPAGSRATYNRFWTVAADPDTDPAFATTQIITVRAAAVFGARGKYTEEATLVTERQ